VALVVGVILCGLFAQGCGGDDGASAGAVELDSGEFVRRANAICAGHEHRMAVESERQFQEATAHPNANINTSEVRRVTVFLVPNLEAELEELEALGEPKGGGIPVEVVLDAIRQVLDEAKADPKEFLDGLSPYARAENIAARYGLLRCPVR